MLLAVMGMCFQPVQAFWKKVTYPSDLTSKGRIQPNEMSDGMTIAFETAVGSNRTGTLCLPTVDGGNVELATLSAEIPLNSVWVIEYNDGVIDAGDYTTYFLKSYSTGQYIGAATVTNGSIKDGSLLKMVSSQEEAVPFAILSQSYGNGFSGTGQSGTGTALYDNQSVVIIANPSVYAKGASIRALNCSANTKVDIKKAIDLSHWSGLRTWDAYAVEEVSGGQAILKALLESYTTSGWTPEKYKGGTLPGCYDESLAEEFSAAYTAVEEAAEDKNVTEDKANELAATLNELQAAIANTLVPLSDGYYYIKSANSELGDIKALYSGTSLNDQNSLMWGAFDEWEAAQVYKVTKTGTDAYSIQNLLTGYYINIPASYSSQTTSAVTSQIIKSGTVGGEFYITNSTKTTYYTALDATEDEGFIGYDAAAPSSASAWTFTPVDETMVAAIEEGCQQARLNIKFAKLLEEAKEEYNNTATITKIDTESPLVTEASQFTTNAPEPLNSVGVENLIDNNEATYFHTRWSGASGAKEPHYLCAYFKDGVSGDIAFSYIRRQNNTNNYPTAVTIYSSNDSVTWTEVAQMNLAMQEAYISPIITLANPVKYLKYSVTATSNGKASNGEVAFSYAEFNYYPAYVDSLYSASVRADLKDALSALNTAITNAESVEDATEEDLATLQAAYDAYVAIYPDYSLIENRLNAINTYLASVPVSTTNELGYYSDEAMQTTSENLENLAISAGLTSLTRVQVDSIVTEMDKILSEFKYSLNVGDVNKLYQINVATGRGMWNVRSSANQPGNVIWCETSVADNAKQGTYWQLRHASDSSVYIQNASSGLYLKPSDPNGTKITYMSATPYAYTVTALGSGYLSFMPIGKTEGALYAELGTDGTRLSNNTSVPALKNHNAWQLIEAEDPTFTTTMKVNDIRIITLPFRTSATPTCDGAATRYVVVNATTDEDGAVTQIELASVDDDSYIKEGTPIIYETGVYTNYDSNSDDVTVDLKFDTDSIVLTSTASEEGVNGLYGVLYNKSMSTSGRGYFSAGLLKPIEDGSSVTIKGQTGYIDVTKITDIRDQYNDDDIITVEVDGSIINSIKNALINKAANVNVYTTDGVLVKKGVKAANATEGLAKGIYIVGKQKVVVK